MSKQTCEQLIQSVRTKRSCPVGVSDLSNPAPNDQSSVRVDKQHRTRKSKRIHLEERQELVDNLFAKACVSLSRDTKNKPLWIEPAQLLCYDIGGKYGLHSDAENFCAETHRFYRFIDRDFSMLIYLNDDYQGGELNFKGLNYTYKPKAGDLVIFPSNHIFSHQSMPITRGRKYALVTWGAVEGSARVSPPKQRMLLS